MNTGGVTKYGGGGVNIGGGGVNTGGVKTGGGGVNTGGVNTGGIKVNTGGGGGIYTKTGGADCARIALLGALDGEDPKTFVALTVKVYEIPGVSPPTVTGEDVEDPVSPPGLDVAIYVI